MPEIAIGKRAVGDKYPTYFIADIAANHDGELSRAKNLIWLASQAGASAAKFQNFQAPSLVSDRGFSELKQQAAHQAKWKKSVFEMYKDASIPWDWTPELRAECSRAGIDYLSTPYDLGAVNMLDPHVPAFKAGSGDITWPEILSEMASKGKPVLLATGAANLSDILRAVRIIESNPGGFALLQCNTNYTGSSENFKHINLRVLKTFQTLFPDAVLGLSDHTPGHTTTLGAVSLGARIIEKHFTDDSTREGSDHPFSMNPLQWREMVDRTQELEWALGGTIKKIEDNEVDTVVVQQRCLRFTRDVSAGASLTKDMLEPLRPAPRGSILPYDLDAVLGLRLRKNRTRGNHLEWVDLERA